MSFAPTATAVLNYWVRILAALEKKINRQSFDTWLKPTRFSHVNGKTLFVRVPSAEFQHIGQKYADLIQEAIDNLNLEIETVTFQTPAQDPTVPKLREDGGFAPLPTHSPNAPVANAPGNASGNRLNRGNTAPPLPAVEQARFDWSAASQLNPKYVFDAFVIGSGNQFAMAASQAVAERPFEGLQPAVSLWRIGDGQDPPDAGDRARCETAAAPCIDHVYLGREVYERDDQLCSL